MAPTPVVPSLLRVGRVVGDYILVGELGRGGFGVVFEAEDRRDGSRVALKTLRADLSSAQGQRALTRFLLEVRAVRQIRHPNVVRYVDAGQLSGEDGSVLAYFAMELLHGETLDQLVRAHGPMAPLQAGSVIRQAGVGLYTAHAQGIIHRDIKPGNVILTPGGRAVVTDFGVCKILEVHNVTAAGQVVGTARYLSPEQLLGSPVDARSDVFALGALLYYLLTGEHLRQHKDLLILSRGVAEGEDVQRARDAPGVAAPFKRVLARAVAVDPAARFPDALQLAHAIEEASLSRDVLQWEPPTPGTPLTAEPARRPAVADLDPDVTEPERDTPEGMPTEVIQVPVEGSTSDEPLPPRASTAPNGGRDPSSHSVKPWHILAVAVAAALVAVGTLAMLWP